jgi:hypothetical protein
VCKVFHLKVQIATIICSNFNLVCVKKRKNDTEKPGKQLEIDRCFVYRGQIKDFWHWDFF